MNTILTKLIKDFRFAGGRLLLLILAAGLSAWGISSVTYSYFLSERDFAQNFARTFPADLEIVVDDYQEGLSAKLLAQPDITVVERREVLGGRVKSAGGAWMPLVVYGVDDRDDIKLDVFRVVTEVEGPLPKLLIETNARYFLDPAWDSIRVQIPGYPDTAWKIAGTSHDARLAPARMERAVFAHALDLQLLEPYLPPGRRRLLIETSVPKAMPELQAVGEQIRSVIEANGSKLVLLNIPAPGEHMHQNIVDGVAFLQRSSGLVLALMGTILLSLILLTWVLPQVSDIGVMKALGAATSNIFKGYLLAVLTVILLGLAIGIPAGYYTAVGYNQFVAFIQNFEPVKDILPLPIHLLVLSISLIIPLIVAVWPIRKAAATTVNAALHKTFFTIKPRLFRRLEALVAGPTQQYNLNNLFRAGPRTLLLIFLIAAGIGLFLTGINLKHSVSAELTDFARSAKYNVRVRLGQELTNQDIAFLYDLPFVKSISPLKDRTVTYRPPKLSYKRTGSARYLSSRHVIQPDFVLTGTIDRKCSNCVYLCGESVRQEFADTPLGSPIELTLPSGETRTYIYSGRFRDMAAIGSPFFIFDDKATATFNALAFEIDPAWSYPEVLNGIDDALLEKGIDMQGLISVNMRIAQLQGHLEPTYLIIRTSGLITIFLGILGLLIVLRLSIQERTREIGIIKSIGGSRRNISGLLLREFLSITVLAIVLGVLLALPLTITLCQVLGETVIYHQIPARNDLPVTGALIVVLLGIQALLISVYTRLKIKKNARELMDHHF